MKIWMYCTGLKHPAIYLQNNEFNRIDLFVSRALKIVNMCHGIPIIANEPAEWRREAGVAAVL